MMNCDILFNISMYVHPREFEVFGLIKMSETSLMIRVCHLATKDDRINEGNFIIRDTYSIKCLYETSKYKIY
jgi:hypothetical protein